MYTDKYIALLETENAELKKRCLALEESLKETKKDLLTAITKWNEAVDKLHISKIPFNGWVRSLLAAVPFDQKNELKVAKIIDRSEEVN